MEVDLHWNGLKHEHNRMPVRREQRLKLRVQAIPTNGVTVGYQHIAYGEPREVIIYKSQLDEVKALMRTPEEDAAEKAAIEKYEARVAAFIKRHRLDSVAAEQGYSSAQLLKLAERHSSFAEEVGAGPYADLATDLRFRTGLGTLRVLDVIEELPEPPTDATRRDEQVDKTLSGLADALAKLAERMQGNGQALSVEALEALIEKKVSERVREKNRNNG